MDASRLVFTSVESTMAAKEYIDWRQENEGGGMPLYIKSLDFDGRNGFLPVLPGELISVLGRPGNGKTGFMFRWARMRARDLQKQAALGSQNAANSVVVYITMEQTVEELRLFHVAAEDKISVTKMASGQMQPEDWQKTHESLNRLAPVPLWFIGKSRKRRRDKIELNEQNIRAALESVEKWQDDNLTTQIDSIYIDYLQRFHSTGTDLVAFYGNTTNALKEWAGDFSTRLILGVQAKREVDQRQEPIPLMDDGQWTSTIEQFSDGVISVMRPAHYRKVGEDFMGIAVTREDMLVSVLKRKLGPDNFSKWVKFEPEYNKLDEAELKNVAFEE